MMNEEEYIRQKMGERNPFTVPEGYFDQLAQQIIDRLPAEDAKPKPSAIERYLRPLLYAAACLAIAVMGTAIYTNRNLTADQQQLAQQETVTSYSDSYIDEAADYAMLDNAEIYNSLLADM